MVMKYGGEDFFDNMVKIKLGYRDLVYIFKDLLKIIYYINQEGYFYGDFKAENLLVDKKNKKMVLIDFDFLN